MRASTRREILTASGQDDRVDEGAYDGRESVFQQIAETPYPSRSAAHFPSVFNGFGGIALRIARIYPQLLPAYRETV
jgi:hypothetical protein